MTVLLHSDMILTALAPLDTDAHLDTVGRSVYRCAEKNMTVRQTVAAACLSQETVEQSVCELVSLKKIAVRPPDAARSPEEAAFLAELEAFHEAARNADHYELLGVEPDTPRVEMRNRYFELSKRFHPDKAFGRIAQAQKDKMAYVFQRLTVAYDVLSNARRREEYNASIADRLELRALERQLKAAVAEKKSTSAPPADAVSRPPMNGSSDAPSSQARATSPSVPARSGDSPRESGAGGRRFTPSMPPDPSVTRRRDEMRKRRAEQAMADLLRRRTDSPSPPPTARIVDRQLADATTALKEERFADAAALAKRVLQSVPDHKQAAEVLKDATEGQGRNQGQMHLRRGHYALREGQIKEAKWHLEQAAGLDKQNTDARHLLAHIRLQYERDAIGALALMKEVIVLGGQRSRYFATLGDIFLELKDSPRAADAYNKALRLDGDNRELKKKLRLCKK